MTYDMTKHISGVTSLLILLFFSFSLIMPARVTAQDKETRHVSKSRKKKEAVTTGQGNASALIDAKRLEISGNIKDAEDLYRKYTDRYPDDPNGHFELARLLANENKVDEATKQAELSARLDPDNIWRQLFLAELYQFSNNTDGAIRIYEKVVEENPDIMDYYEQLAALYLTAGKFNDAIRVFDQIEAKVGPSEEISLQKEKIYLQQKDFARAEDVLQQLIKANPTESKYYAMLAELYMSKGMPDKALALYQKIQEIDPDDAYIHMTLADFYRKQGNKEKSYDELKLGFANPNLDIDTKVRILLSFYNINELTDALQGQALELADILTKTHPQEAKSFSIYGDLLVQAKKYPEAREEFLNALSLDSTKYPIWESVLRLDLLQSEWTHLNTYGTEAIALFPEQPTLYLFTALADFQLKDYDKALTLLNQGVKLVANDNDQLSQFYMYLGDTYHALNRPEDSDKAYEQSLAIKYDNAYVLNNYSYYLTLRNKDLPKAEQMAKQAVALEPDNSSFQDTYGWALFRSGKYKEAREWVGKALEDKENVSGEVLEHYGDILFRLDDPEGAMEYWKKAEVKGGGTPLLERKIAEKKLIEKE
jgi:tetratricopeptide (TPR) repeat protein